MKGKVMVAMSGGVDSSVAAVILKEDGYDVIGATLKLFGNEDIGINDKTKTCCSLTDIMDARDVAFKLGVNHYVFNFGKDFENEVIKRFAKSYSDGQTPNPCIDCNRFIKFSKLLDRAMLLDMDYIATGHYARIEFDENSGRYLLKKAVDSSKDQSYVLYFMSQEELSKTLFPLGEKLKIEVREYANQHGLVNANKPDSQDICFVKDGDYAGFLTDIMGIKSENGDFIDKEGKILGTHHGIINYTIGQRKGLNLSLNSPKYVIEKNKENNTIKIGDEQELYSTTLVAGYVNLISIEKLTGPIEVTAKTRYKQREAPAILYPLDENKIKVEFKTPQRAITKGQAVVFYNGDIVVGGGTII